MYEFTNFILKIDWNKLMYPYSSLLASFLSLVADKIWILKENFIKLDGLFCVKIVKERNS